METLRLARAKHLLDRVSNNVKYPTLDGSPALPTEAAALIEYLGKLGLDEDADAMRKDFIVYFAHEVRLPNTGLDPRLVEFVSKANELFGPFLKYSGPEGDWTVVRLRLIDQFDGLRITFKKLSMLSSPLTEDPAAEFVFAPDGDGFYIAGFGECGRVRNLKGFRQILQLINSPNTPVPMTTLHADVDVPRNLADPHSKQSVADEQYRSEVWEKLTNAKAKLERAQTVGNGFDEVDCKDEVEKWQGELNKLGIDGHDRDMNNPADKLRPSIHGCLNRAYQALRDANPPMKELAGHFEASIEACSATFVYQPAGDVPAWSKELPKLEK